MAQTEQMKQNKSEKTESKNSPLRPIGNRVLVRRLVQDEKLKGGILLPDSAKKKQELAEVVAIGAGKKEKSGVLTPVPVKVGDVIIMEKYSGQEITLDDVEYSILRGEDILAIVEK